MEKDKKQAPLGLCIICGEEYMTLPHKCDPTYSELVAKLEYIEEQVAKVYCHITNDQLSYYTYDAETVITCADDCMTKHVEEETKDIKLQLANALKQINKNGKKTLNIGMDVIFKLPRWKMIVIKWFWPDFLRFIESLFEYCMNTGEDTVNNYTKMMSIDWGRKQNE